MCRTSKIYLQIAVSLSNHKWPFFSSIKLRVSKIVPQLRTAIPKYRNLRVSAAVLLKASAVDTFADFGHVDFQSQ